MWWKWFFGPTEYPNVQAQAKQQEPVPGTVASLGVFVAQSMDRLDALEKAVRVLSSYDNDASAFAMAMSEAIGKIHERLDKLEAPPGPRKLFNDAMDRIIALEANQSKPKKVKTSGKIQPQDGDQKDQVPSGS